MYLGRKNVCKDKQECESDLSHEEDNGKDGKERKDEGKDPDGEHGVRWVPGGTLLVPRILASEPAVSLVPRHH